METYNSFLFPSTKFDALNQLGRVSVMLIRRYMPKFFWSSKIWSNGQYIPS